jgi:hypothetical protein
MSYKTRNGKIVRGGKKTLKLYHFTPPHNLPDILRDGLVPHTRDGAEAMLPGVDAVWMTADPEGNTITDAHLEVWRRYGDVDVLAAYAAGRRWLFGCNEYGCARLTIEVRKNNPHLANYLELLGPTIPSLLRVCWRSGSICSPASRTGGSAKRSSHPTASLIYARSAV